MTEDGSARLTQSEFVDVSSARVSVVRQPCEPPFAIDWIEISETVYIVCELFAEGESGLGFCFTFDAEHALPMANLMAQLATKCFRSKPTPAPSSVRATLRRMLSLTGYPGIGISCAAAIETALWDLIVRAAKLDWSSYFGRVADRRYPAYVTCGSVSSSPYEVAVDVRSAVAQGYHLVKIKVGADEKRDELRLAAAYEAAGDGCRLLIDANQTWTAKSAARLLERWRRYNLVWVEEPLPAHDLAGLAWLRDRVDVSIATGESYYDTATLAEIIERRAADVLTVNPQKVGGVSAFDSIVNACNLACMAVTCHTFGEIAAPLLGNAVNVPAVEIVPWMHGAFSGGPVVVDGELTANSGPGLGVSLAPEAKSRTIHQIDFDLQ